MEEKYYRIKSFDSLDHVRTVYNIPYIWWTARAGNYLGCVFCSPDSISDALVEEIDPESNPQFAHTPMSDSICITIRGDELTVKEHVPRLVEYVTTAGGNYMEENIQLAEEWIPKLVACLA